MTEWTTLLLASGTDADYAWEQLMERGLNPLFTAEAPDGTTELVVSDAPEQIPANLSFVVEIRPCAASQEIDWEAQWRTHGHNYRNGFVHVSVCGRSLRLTPGPGFGDLSHPTTHLALEMMSPYVKDKVVLDVGSGSGVLTLAAAAAGAAKAYGVDIDSNAVLHAQQNATINNLDDAATFAEQLNVSPHVIVINMIWSEQRLAWQQWSAAAQQAQQIIVSGLLVEERDAYLDYVMQWPWTLQEERHLGGWLALRFASNASCAGLSPAL